MAGSPRTSWVQYNSDRLVTRWMLPNGKRVSLGKRVSADCPLTHGERALYVNKGIVACVAAVRTRLNCSLADALKLVNKVRGVGVWEEHKTFGTKPSIKELASI